MVNSYLKARLGMYAALATLLLTAFASHSHASTSTNDGDLQIAPSVVEFMPNHLDDSCLPPSGLAACAAWHQVIRANFSSREIGILFGTATSYPEYATAYSRIKSRYARLHDEFSAERFSPGTVSVN